MMGVNEVDFPNVCTATELCFTLLYGSLSSSLSLPSLVTAYGSHLHKAKYSLRIFSSYCSKKDRIIHPNLSSQVTSKNTFKGKRGLEIKTRVRAPSSEQLKAWRIAGAAGRAQGCVGHCRRDGPQRQEYLQSSCEKVLASFPAQATIHFCSDESDSDEEQEEETLQCQKAGGGPGGKGRDRLTNPGRQPGDHGGLGGKGLLPGPDSPGVVRDPHPNKPVSPSPDPPHMCPGGQPLGTAVPGHFAFPLGNQFWSICLAFLAVNSYEVGYNNVCTVGQQSMICNGLVVKTQNLLLRSKCFALLQEGPGFAAAFIHIIENNATSFCGVALQGNIHIVKMKKKKLLQSLNLEIYAYVQFGVSFTNLEFYDIILNYSQKAILCIWPQLPGGQKMEVKMTRVLLSQLSMTESRCYYKDSPKHSDQHDGVMCISFGTDLNTVDLSQRVYPKAMAFAIQTFICSSWREKLNAI
eukprot:bmy_09734T0